MLGYYTPGCGCQKAGDLVMDWLKLKRKLDALLATMKQAEDSGMVELGEISSEQLPSLRNFIHYLALRQKDVRSLQLELADLGLSSFGRSEGYVMGSFQAISDRVQDAIDPDRSIKGARPKHSNGLSNDLGEGHLSKNHETSTSPLSWKRSEGILHKNTRRLFGPKPENRHVYIMVTAPMAERATDLWLDQLIDAGMNILRINAAHEPLDGIFRLIKNARTRAELKNKPLKILVDVPGPKLRTEALSPGIPILKLRPERTVDGKVTKPATVEIHSTQETIDPYSPLPQLLISSDTPLTVGQSLHFVDSRDKKRTMIIVGQSPTDPPIFRCLISKTCYLGPATIVHWKTKSTSEGSPSKARATLTHTHFVPWSAEVPVGGCFGLVRAGFGLDQRPQGLRSLPTLGTCEAIFEALSLNTPVIFDDGKIVTHVSQIYPEGVVLQVKQAVKGFARLRDAMGINLPGVNLEIAALSPEDRILVDAVKDHVDLLGISFVRSVADMNSIKEALGTSSVPLMLKIETRSGFQNLPEILLSVLGEHNIAVMIARGDLAVECGFERLAEVQEEILWLCEAAHIPVVWATQVLETLAKTGIPTRAEITDAAMSVRAECVMLNKGLYITNAVRSLDSILMRMEAHQYKKRQLYRPLKLAVPAFIKEPFGPPPSDGASPSPSTELSLH